MKFGYIQTRYSDKRLIIKPGNVKRDGKIIGYTIHSMYMKILDVTLYETAELAWKALDATGHNRLPGMTEVLP